MKVEELRKNLRGVIIPAITPMKEDFSLDLAGLRANLERAIEEGIVNGKGGFIICGGGGELPFLTFEERRQVVQVAVEAARGRAPILAGVQDGGTALSVELAKQMEDVGADGLQLGPPCFYHNHSEDDVFRYYEAVAEAVNIGILAYNTWWTAPNMRAEFIARLAELPSVVGVKWSSPDTSDYLRGFRLWAERLNVIDNEGLHIQSHVMGASGFISGCGDFWPQYDLKIWELLEQGKYRRVREELVRLNWPLYDFRGRIGRLTGGEASVKKAAAELVGRAGGPPRPPTRPLTEKERQELRELLARADVPLV
ncbi:MAG TPA: dihydrodipicolinate synthase family protein [Armatimonadetes bacterium]|nr:dihydrodipicolinate synthase family protein [Armatimonadota bacterium]